MKVTKHVVAVGCFAIAAILYVFSLSELGAGILAGAGCVVELIGWRGLLRR